MAYIENDDITDVVVKAFIDGGDTLSGYHTEVDNHMDDFAARKGVSSSSSIDTTDGKVTNYTIKRYLIAYFCMRVCEDKLGKNNVDIAQDEKYAVKADMYAKQVKSLALQITYETITGTEAERADYTGTAYTLRG